MEVSCAALELRQIGTSKAVALLLWQQIDLPALFRDTDLESLLSPRHRERVSHHCVDVLLHRWVEQHPQHGIAVPHTDIVAARPADVTVLDLSQ